MLLHFVSFFILLLHPPFSFFFFFNDTATTEIYTLSLHDALPILGSTDQTPNRLRPCFRPYTKLSGTSDLHRSSEKLLARRSGRTDAPRPQQKGGSDLADRQESRRFAVHRATQGASKFFPRQRIYRHRRRSPGPAAANLPRCRGK